MGRYKSLTKGIAMKKLARFLATLTIVGVVSTLAACGGSAPIPAQYWDGIWQGTCAGVAYNVDAPKRGADYDVYGFNLDLPLTSGYVTLEVYGYATPSDVRGELTVAPNAPRIAISGNSGATIAGQGRTFLMQPPYNGFVSAHAAEVVVRNSNFSVTARCPVWGPVIH